MSDNLPGYILALQNRTKRRVSQGSRVVQNDDILDDYRMYRTQNNDLNNYDYMNNQDEIVHRKRQRKRKSTTNMNQYYKNQAFKDYNQKGSNQKQDDNSNDQIKYSLPESQISIPAEEFTEEDICPHIKTQNNVSDFDDVAELKQINVELQDQIRELEAKNKRLQFQITQNEKLDNDDMRLALQQQKNANSQLQMQLDKAQLRISQLEQIISLKEESIQKMTNEFQQASSTMKDHMDIMKTQAIQLEQANSQIVALKLELERYKRTQPAVSACSSMNDFVGISASSSNYSYGNNDQKRLQAAIISDPSFNGNNVNLLSQPKISPMISASSSNAGLNFNINQTQIAKYDGNNHPAMRDNLRFGEFQPPLLNFNVEAMSDEEIRSLFNEYTKTKEEIEWKLNRVPAKGSNMSHVRAERERMEAEVDDYHRKISKLKYEMKKRNIY